MPFKIRGFPLIFALLSIFPFFFYLHGSISPDESYFLFMGNSTLHGVVPYTDYPTGGLKTPAIFYLNALIILIFKEPIDTIYAARCVLYAVNALSAIVIYLIGRKFYSEKIGMLSSILFLIGISIPVYEGYLQLTEPYMEFFVLIGVLIFLKSKKLTYYLLAGFFFGISILFKQSGILFIIAICIYYLLSFLITQNQTNVDLRATFDRLIMIILGVSVPLTLISFYLWSNGALNNFIYWSFIYITMEYKKSFIFTGSLAYTLAYQFLSYGVLWVMSIVSLIIITAKFFLKKCPEKDLFLAIWLLTTIYVLTIRQFGHYYIQILPAACLLASVSFASIHPSLSLDMLRKSLRNGDYLKIFMFVSLIGIILPTILIAPYSGYKLIDSRSLEFGFQVQAAEYIQFHTSPNDEILSFPYEPSMYWLSQRKPAINDLAILPTENEHDIFNQIERDKVKYIILDNIEKVSENHKYAYKFVLENYELEKIIGNFYIYRLKNDLIKN